MLVFSFLFFMDDFNQQAIETRDIVLKKMIYLYLCNYAKSEPEMAIMAINSLRRDW